MKEIKTIKIASTVEKPIYLKALVKTKYTKYKAIIGKIMYKIHKPIFVNSVKAIIMKYGIKI